MDLHQLKTFVVVARAGSITRASELVHLSQPAVSAHIKAIEDALGLTLFERTPRGMSLTAEGTRLLAKAEQTLGAHQALLVEASRLKGQIAGRIRIGAGSNSNLDAVGLLLASLARTHPDVEVTLAHGSSHDVVARLRDGRLDAAFYNEGGEPPGDLTTVEVARFQTYLVAPPHLVPALDAPDWGALAAQPWIYPTASACCGRAAEALFEVHRIRPRRIIGVDREQITRTLVAGGLGVGLLHADTAHDAHARGEVELVCASPSVVRVMFATLASRGHEPLLAATRALLR